jgi:hypothetical protein
MQGPSSAGRCTETVEYRIEISGANINPPEVALYRPAMDEYLKLIQDLDDIPSLIPD